MKRQNCIKFCENYYGETYFAEYVTENLPQTWVNSVSFSQSRPKPKLPSYIKNSLLHSSKKIMAGLKSISLRENLKYGFC